MKGITGEPYDEEIGTHISGKDSLVVSVHMDFTELQEKLELYYSQYRADRYKKIGFDWVDNVSEVRDSVLSDELNFKLADAIVEHKTEHLHIAPPETTDWSKVIGFCYSGYGKKTDDPKNYSLNLDLTEYIESIKPDSKVYKKIRRDRLYGMTAEGTPFVISSIYSSLVYQTEYEQKHYILCSGSWYQVDTSFLNQVDNFIRTKITIADINLPDCGENEHEGDYNERVAKSNDDFCPMDKRLVSVLGGPKQVEACDIFTKNKQFIHVKNKGQSAQLSHLFAQGKISAECFISDEDYRRQVAEKVNKEFGTTIFDYTQKPKSNEYEVVYAIIDDKDSKLEDKLPFFSKVNLMLTAQELERMHFKYSVCLIKKQN